MGNLTGRSGKFSKFFPHYYNISNAKYGCPPIRFVLIRLGNESRLVSYLICCVDVRIDSKSLHDLGFGVGINRMGCESERSADVNTDMDHSPNRRQTPVGDVSAVESERYTSVECAFGSYGDPLLSQPSKRALPAGTAKYCLQLRRIC